VTNVSGGSFPNLGHAAANLAQNTRLILGIQGGPTNHNQESWGRIKERLEWTNFLEI
jgi:hypothetical protein